MKITALVGCLFLSTFVIGQQKIEKEFTGIDKINMSTSSGDCLVKRSTGDKVTVMLEHTFDKDRYEPVMEQEGGTLRIKEIFNGNSYSGNAKWTISVPDNIDFKMNTGSGDFEVSNLTLALDLNTGSGDYIFDNMKGEIMSNSGSGDIRLTSFDGEIKVNTGSGDIRIERSKGELNLNSGSGSIDIRDSDAGIYANVGSGDILARGIVVSKSSSFNSGSGDVEVALAASPKADISVNSGSGDAELDYEGNEIEGLITMKANKKNGDISAPFDFDTTEELQYDRQTVIKKTAKIGSDKIKINVSTGSGTASISK